MYVAEEMAAIVVTNVEKAEGFGRLVHLGAPGRSVPTAAGEQPLPLGGQPGAGEWSASVSTRPPLCGEGCPAAEGPPARGLGGYAHGFGRTRRPVF